MTKNKNTIRLWWHPNEGRANFGDILNPYMVRVISGLEPVWTPIKWYSLRKVHVVIGSVLSVVKWNCVVWGAGIVQKREMVAKARFCAVRGPLTGKRLVELGYTDPGVYGDPALLLPRFYTPKIGPRFKLGIIPHYVDYENVKDRFKGSDVHVINLLNDDIECVINEITSCDCAISSSLHGIIVSHAYGIPCLWTEFSDKLFGDGIKFNDYFLSVGIAPYNPAEVTLHETAEEICRKVMSAPTINSIQVDFQSMMDKLMAACPFRR